MKNLEVIIRKETKRGARFYKYGKHSMRLFPVKTADVELMKVEGTIEIVDSEGNVIWTPAVEVEVVNEEAVAEALAEELNGKHGTITGEEALELYIEGKKQHGEAFEDCVIHSMLLLVVNTAKKLFPKFIGTIWELLDYVEKCKRAVEIIQEDYAVGMSQEDVQDIYNKGAELYGKAFTDAVPQEILDYIQGGTIIYKGVNGNLEELKVDLNDLEQLQELVGGNIQTVELPCNIIMVVNESGWVDNLPMNFRLNNLAIFGDVFFCSYNDADFVGLSTMQKRFIKEEIFKQIGVRLT